MKPLGPIPAGYAAIDGELAIAGRKASDLVTAGGGTPLFGYSRERLAGRVAELRAVMPYRRARQNAVHSTRYATLL